MLIAGCAVKAFFVYVCVAKRRYVLLSINAVLTSILCLYVPVYYPQGVTVLDLWKYAFLWSSQEGTVLWRDVAVAVILLDFLCALAYGLLYAMHKLVERTFESGQLEDRG